MGSSSLWACWREDVSAWQLQRCCLSIGPASRALRPQIDSVWSLTFKQEAKSARWGSLLFVLLVTHSGCYIHLSALKSAKGSD
ncbi:hypothetical protein FKM82_015753 [Ascaphus truei]